MCGIAGIWGQPTHNRLEAMAESLHHRGPDEHGFFNSPDDTVGLAHRRLAIIDVKDGRQPIANEDGTITTVFNGAIYNYRELREELIDQGHHFNTKTDTEVIVHLYEQHGCDFTTKLRGMFAIAVWDERQRQLVVTRDRAGEKPLYYSEENGEFIFASQIRAITAAIDNPPVIDPQALADYLTWCCIPAPGTIYRNIRAVEPAQTLVIRDRRVCTTNRYWQLSPQPKANLNHEDAVEQIHQLLRESVKLQLRADVPVAAFLSGGIDSGLIVALASQETARQLVTVTIGFDDADLDERQLARTVATQYKTDHHEVLVKPDVAADLPAIAKEYDQPFADSSAVPAYYVAKTARNFAKVVLNGDGGDELFAGYRRYIAARTARHISPITGPAGKTAWKTLKNLLPTPRGFRTPYAFLHRWIRGMALPPPEQYLAWAVDAFAKTELQKTTLNSSSMIKDQEIILANRLAITTLQRFTDCGPVDQMINTDFTTLLPNDLLVKTDIATMANSLESRAPFLDHHLIDTVSRYPERLKLPGRTTKPLLRAVARQFLPDIVTRAPKRGFEVPLTEWLNNDLQALSKDVLLARNGLLDNLFQRSELEHLVSRKNNLEPARWSRRVWLLLILGLWDDSVRK